MVIKFLQRVTDMSTPAKRYHHVLIFLAIFDVSLLR